MMLVLGKNFPNLIYETLKSQKLKLIIPLMLISTIIPSGCAFIVGGAATGGGLALQERSIGDAVVVQPSQTLLRKWTRGPAEPESDPVDYTSALSFVADSPST